MIDPLPRTQTNLNNLRLSKALMTIRIIWFAVLMGPILFMGVLVLQILPNMKQPVQQQPILVWACVIMFLTVIPVTFTIRRLIFKRGAVGEGIKPAAYSSGNIVFWAGCEGSAFFGLVVAMLNGSLWPTIVVVGMALALQALTFPMAGKMSVPDDAGAQ